MIFIEAEDNWPTATDNPTRIRARTKITPTAFHSLPTSSIVVSTQIDATRMAIAMAIFCIAFAFRSHEIPSRTLPKLFNAFPAPLRRSSILPKALAIPLNALASFFRIQSMATITPPAKILPHSMFPLSSVIAPHKLLNTSTNFSPTFLRTPTTLPIIYLIPLISPWKKSTAVSNAFHEGDCTPKASLKASTKLRQKFTTLSMIPETLKLIPFLNPAIKSFPI